MRNLELDMLKENVLTTQESEFKEFKVTKTKKIKKIIFLERSTFLLFFL